MKKRYGCIALAAFLLAGSVLTVHAEDVRKDGWKADYTGDAIESNFSSRDFADAVENLLPGDSVTINVSVKNSSKKNANFYASNEVLQSLEDSSKAKGGAYSYDLTWKGAGDKVILYSSESVGGENEGIPANLQGLHGATDNLEDFFYLDQLASGEEGLISLRVALNGETQGNNYQNTLARLRLNFAVEEAAAGESRRITRRGESTVVYTPGAVQTSDPARMMFWSVATLISGLGFLICAVLYQRRSRGGDERE